MTEKELLAIQERTWVEINPPQSLVHSKEYLLLSDVKKGADNISSHYKAIIYMQITYTAMKQNGYMIKTFKNPVQSPISDWASLNARVHSSFKEEVLFGIFTSLFKGKYNKA